MGDNKHTCSCSPHQVARYRNRISGPLLDRIDLHVEVPAVPYRELKGVGQGADSATMRTRIQAAREVQARRYADVPVRINADLSGRLLDEFCALDAQGHAFLEQAVGTLGLSARAYTRILRIARTIADIEGADSIGVPQLAEAVNYRSLDRARI